MTKYTTIKGVKDITPPEIAKWHLLEKEMKRAFNLYRFAEIRLPIFEKTAVFVRSIGDTTDIVEKEMYTFEDRGGESLTLRPEGTASVVRAYVEHQMFNDTPIKRLYYTGPMFRRERPQAGRYRQFYQIGAEIFGENNPEVDAETITMLMEALANLKLKKLTLNLNSLGCDKCRPVFKESLKKFVKDRIDSFCPNCQNRYERNPLRIFDCKVPGCKEATETAPTIDTALCSDCVEHFESLKESLKKSGVEYFLNNRLVRGLDYYSKTTFEISAEGLGAQNSIAGGGRYDKLVEEFGGPKTPAFGFALGVERTVALIEESLLPKNTLDIFIAAMGNEAKRLSFEYAASLRKEGITVERNYSGNNLKKLLKKANQSGAKYSLIIGDNEIERGKLLLRDMESGEQEDISLDKAVAEIEKIISNSK